MRPGALQSLTWGQMPPGPESSGPIVVINMQVCEKPLVPEGLPRAAVLRTASSNSDSASYLFCNYQ